MKNLFVIFFIFACFFNCSSATSVGCDEYCRDNTCPPNKKEYQCLLECKPKAAKEGHCEPELDNEEENYE